MYRTVNSTEADRVLKEIEKKLRSYPFNFKAATILSGAQEGAFGWVTVNYLNENFAKVRSHPSFKSDLSNAVNTGSDRRKVHIRIVILVLMVRN